LLWSGVGNIVSSDPILLKKQKRRLDWSKIDWR
jgi:hypothetical protein